jgi:hypothetical protein
MIHGCFMMPSFVWISSIYGRFHGGRVKFISKQLKFRLGGKKKEEKYLKYPRGDETSRVNKNKNSFVKFSASM